MGEQPSSVTPTQSYAQKCISVNWFGLLRYALLCAQGRPRRSTRKPQVVPTWLQPVRPQGIFGTVRCINPPHVNGDMGVNSGITQGPMIQEHADITAAHIIDEITIQNTADSSTSIELIKTNGTGTSAECAEGHGEVDMRA